MLLVLACPLMMMLMMRGGHGHGGHVHGHSGGCGHDHREAPTERKSAAELRNQRDELDRLIEEREAEEKTPTTFGGGWQ